MLDRAEHRMVAQAREYVVLSGSSVVPGDRWSGAAKSAGDGAAVDVGGAVEVADGASDGNWL